MDVPSSGLYDPNASARRTTETRDADAIDRELTQLAGLKNPPSSGGETDFLEFRRDKKLVEQTYGPIRPKGGVNTKPSFQRYSSYELKHFQDIKRIAAEIRASQAREASGEKAEINGEKAGELQQRRHVQVCFADLVDDGAAEDKKSETKSEKADTGAMRRVTGLFSKRRDHKK